MNKPDEIDPVKGFINNLNIGVELHPEILISTKSGREFTAHERAELFKSLDHLEVSQASALTPLIEHTHGILPSLITPSKQLMPPRQSNEVMDAVNHLGKWIEENITDPGLLKDSAMAIGAISTAHSRGLPIASAANSILPVILQVAMKLVGAG